MKKLIIVIAILASTTANANDNGFNDVLASLDIAGTFLMKCNVELEMTNKLGRDCERALAAMQEVPKSMKKADPSAMSPDQFSEIRAKRDRMDKEYKKMRQLMNLLKL